MNALLKFPDSRDYFLPTHFLSFFATCSLISQSPNIQFLQISRRARRAFSDKFPCSRATTATLFLPPWLEDSKQYNVD